MPKKSHIDLSIVIPSYNTRQLLVDCFDSIEQSIPVGVKVEVIVVDNASSDGSIEYLKSLRTTDYRLQLIFNKENVGFARAVNQGWKAAAGELILFLNSDTVVGRPTIKTLIQFAKDHQEVGAISGKTMLRDGSLDPDSHRGFPTPWSSLTFFLGLEKLFPKSKIFGQYHQGWKDINTIHEIDAGAGALLLVPKKVLREVGGWDEDYFFYGEDIDLCFRIKEKGYKIIFHPGTDVVHYKGASSGLRKESRNIATPQRENLIKVTKGSINAWKIFYKKFYKDKYPFFVTWAILLGIELKGFARLAYQRFRPL